VLGILPGGRGNDFARSLEIPRDPLAACQVLLDGRVRRIDVGDCAGETFVGIASIGLESEVTRLANNAPRIGGEATYALATVIGIARWKAARFDLVLDGGEARSFTGFIAGVANSGRFGGGMKFAPDAKLDDGLFDVVVIEDGPRWRFVADTPKVFKGTHVHDPRVQVFRAAEVKLDSDRPFEVYADGDPIGSTPATVRVVPAALQVLAP
jgi:YegS/Rv2252/BmrU family lipid kinase